MKPRTWADGNPTGALRRAYELMDELDAIESEKEKFPIACEQELATIKLEGLGIDPKDWGKSKRELQEPCEYCVSGVCGNETIYDEMDRGFMAHVRDGILNIGVATANFHEHSEMKINYCPMCGRKLEVEE